MPIPERIAGIRDRIDQTAGRALDVAQSARRRWTPVDVAWTAQERDRRAVGNVLAGALAFRIFVYLLPLFLAVIVLIGVVAGIDDDAPRQVGEDLGMSAYVVDSVQTAARQSKRGLWLLVPLALWAMYTGGLGAAKVLRAVHALAWELPVTRSRRNLATAGVTFLVALSAVALVASTQWVRANAPGFGLAALLVSLAPLVALWWFVSALLPHDPDAPRTALLPGALMVGVGLWLAELFSVYVLARSVDKASELYGSLGVAAALLVWLYLLGRLMVASAMLNATLWERRQRS
ncbi:MAG: YhjD/YihY/BrkB family envelope integrity protein [Acidimicrobiales bacterium]